MKQLILSCITALLLVTSVSHGKVDERGHSGVYEDRPEWFAKVGDVCFANDSRVDNSKAMGWADWRPCIVSHVLSNHRYKILLVAFDTDGNNISNVHVVGVETVNWWIVMRASEWGPVAGIPKGFYKLDGKEFLRKQATTR